MKKNIRDIEFTVGGTADGKTCGDFLRSAGVSRRTIIKAKGLAGGMTRFGKTIRTVDRVRTGDIITLRLKDESLITPNGSLYAPVAYEDEDAVVFDKPAGMPVHPSAGHRDDTLGNLFAYMYPDQTFRPINRLDKDTSGLCAVAKNSYAASVLNGNIAKVYYAAAEGNAVPEAPKDTLIKWFGDANGEYVIDAPIGRADGSTILREVRADGKSAVTRYTIIKENKSFRLARIRLETGRTHQIRVHFSAVGHPLAGDELYGGSRAAIDRQALHCGELSFASPRSGASVTVSSPLPEDIVKLF